MQRQTYSAYYGGNVGKGAIGLQLCGWMRTHELWDGAVSDSEYFEKSGILEMQAEFVANDSSNSDIQFTNILDKGYHAVLAAWRVSKQLILQPAYKKSERKFTSAEVLLSAAVAADRSGNERAVNVAKRCFILGKGYGEAVAYEGALKIKEMCYLHAEGYSGGALKHGPFALIESDDNGKFGATPIIMLIFDDDHARKFASLVC